LARPTKTSGSNVGFNFLGGHGLVSVDLKCVDETAGRVYNPKRLLALENRKTIWSLIVRLDGRQEQKDKGKKRQTGGKAP